MKEPDSPDFTFHAITRVECPDGVTLAKEVVTYRRDGGPLKITALQGTDRRLPMPRSEAEGWVDSLLGTRTEAQREGLIEMLCRAGNEALVASAVTRDPRGDKANDARCSFCGKASQAVQRLIAGPGVAICNECVDICSGLLAGDRPAAE